jgi:hypothetical protein
MLATNVREKSEPVFSGWMPARVAIDLTAYITSGMRMPIGQRTAQK